MASAEASGPSAGTACGAAEAGAARGAAQLELCRRCKQDFAPGARAAPCRFHSGDFAGETRQRWADPGDHAGGGDVLEFWTCCGAGALDAPGCKTGQHLSFSDPLPVLEEDYDN
mmetsp:Transcript_1113/g.3236  ORF Transcript_1113/g.3236 Transcript_1113/m.3236 type:complete len:114 (-) Transcript_1113:1135-1476(-)